MDLKEALKGIDYHIWSSEPETAQLLVALMKSIKAQVVVETGVFKGFISCQMIDALPEGGKYIGVDIEDHREESVKKYMKEKNADFLLGSSLDKLDEIPENSVDLIFIDSLHEEWFLKQEFLKCERIIKQNGLICMHDIYSCPGVMNWVQYVQQFKWFEVINLNTSGNRGISIVKCLFYKG